VARAETWRCQGSKNHLQNVGENATAGAAAMSGLFFPMREQAWPKWYRARTISGKPAGLGFCCPKCHLHIRYGAETGVFHCGAMETPPVITTLLPVRSLGPDSNQLPRNLMSVGWDDYEEKTNGKYPIFG
jgi:hypothetical protein